MNRRRFLSFLGGAPVAAVGGAVVAKSAPAGETIFYIDAYGADEDAYRRVNAALAQHRRIFPGIIKDALARTKKA